MNNKKSHDSAHIGIVGCSAEGAALCYRTFCVEATAVFGKHRHPEVSMHTHCLADYMKHIESNNWNRVAELMLSSAQKLHENGAQLLICPDNTIHQVFELVEEKSNLPWLHIARVVAKHASSAAWTQIGVLGTKYLMEGPVYKRICEAENIETIVPDLDDRVRINQIIFDELVNSVFSARSRKYFNHVISKLRDRGCKAVVLGCTEIPLLIDAKECPLPTLDSTRLLARAAISWSANCCSSL